jgi:hypothetical protein
MSGLKADRRGSAPGRRDCSQHGCKATGQGASHAGSCEMSAQHSDHTDGPGRCAHSYQSEGREHAGGNVGVLPRTRRRSIHDSRNLASRAPAASLRDRLRRPVTGARLPSGSAAIGFGGGAWARPGRGQVARNRPGDGEDQGVTLSAAGSHARSHGDEQPSGALDRPEQPEETSPRSRTVLNGTGRRYRNLRI